MATSEFGTGKSVFILTIVAGCFAILWPKIFYPMIAGTEPVKRPIDVAGGCCDVVYEKDVEVLRVLTEMCGRVNNAAPGTALSPAGATACRTAVLSACDFDIATFLNKVEQSKLGRRNRKSLDELRSFNTSACLRRNFGVTPGSLGAPRRMRTWGQTTSRHLRQERPPHLRPEGMHPALRERGRAIPTSHVIPVVETEQPPVATRPPIPGMRPPMGGAGHVVPPPKTGGGTMGIVMPLYTIGIVVFFMYTIMKVFVRKTSEEDAMRAFQPDPEFRKVVFADDYSESQRSQRSVKKEPTPPPVKTSTPDVTRLGWKERDTIMAAIGGLLAEVDKHLEGTQGQYSADPQAKENVPGDDAAGKDEKPDDEPEKVIPSLKQIDELTSKDEPVEKHFTEMKKRPKSDRTLEFLEAEKKREQEQKLSEQIPTATLETPVVSAVAPGVSVDSAKSDEGPCVKVVGVETRARAEGGVEWHPPPSPVLGQPHSRPVTPVSPQGDWLREPHNIFLEGTLPSNSQLLVEDYATELLDDSQRDTAVILSGKMTLSLISVDAAAPQHPPAPTVPSDPESTLLDVETAIIDDSSVDGEAEDEVEGDVEPDAVAGDDVTHYTTANTAGNPNASNSRQDPDADDTAADVSAQDLLDDQEDLQEEYDAIWGAMEMGEDDEEVANEILPPHATGTQHHR